MRNYIKKLLHSPRWQFLKPVLGPYVLTGTPDNQWLRIILNKETQRIVDSLEPGKLKALEISGENWNRPGYFKEYRSVEYPEFDITKDVLDEQFDLIIAEQVFEHLLWPYRAAKNVFQMLKQGGHFLISTPFLIRIHNHPVDCSRWTETGIKYFLAECGFPLENIETGSWGNRSCIVGNFPRWQVYQRWRHSLVNEPDFPVMVWALARK